MAKVIYLDKFRKPAKPKPSRKKDKALFIGGKSLKYYQWRKWCL